MTLTDREIKRLSLLARLDQVDPDMEQQLTDLVIAARGDLAESDRIHVLAHTAAEMADQPALAAVMAAYAIVRLARQEPTP